MKRSVGLVVVIEVNGQRVAVLQRRGEFNHEKMGPESYPGGCQGTAHGGVEEYENFEQALRREIEEELGEDFARELGREEAGEIQELVRLEDEKHSVITYGVKLLADSLSRIRLGPSSGGLALCSETEAANIQNLKDFDKQEGVQDRRVIAMFPDARDAVRKALAILK